MNILPCLVQKWVCGSISVQEGTFAALLKISFPRGFFMLVALK